MLLMQWNTGVLSEAITRTVGNGSLQDILSA